LAVVKPSDTVEVSRVADYAGKYGIPIVPRGAGTGMTGGAVPLRETVVLSMEAMNSIVDIDEQDMVAIVEPGVINGHLQEVLEAKGFFYPPDPASLKFCTIGGNVAENAGGPRAVKYGVTKDYVLGLEAVLPDGSVFTTGGRTYKGVVGYDLTRLLVGSEGTLAIVTKVYLKILPLPEETATLLCTFENINDAARCVVGITSASIIPRTLEFMDRESIIAVESYRKFGLPRDVGAALIVEVDGSYPSVSREAEKIADICRSLNGAVQVAEDSYSRDKLWEARRAISPALYHMRPTKINEDIVVPRGRIPEMIEALGRVAERFNIKIASFGHAGDGNIHVNVMTDKKDEAEYLRAKESVRAIFEETLRLGGTISGEHGIGTTKRPYLRMELSEVNISLMKKIKAVFDPKGILNPGKIFPD
jgi:glycolate oxidase